MYENKEIYFIYFKLIFFKSLAALSAVKVRPLEMQSRMDLCVNPDLLTGVLNRARVVSVVDYLCQPHTRGCHKLHMECQLCQVCHCAIIELLSTQSKAWSLLASSSHLVVLLLVYS